jgi:LCP family protein required for cell wall assembly
MTYYKQPNFNQFIPKSKKKRLLRGGLFILTIFFLIYGLFTTEIVSREIEVSEKKDTANVWTKVVGLFSLSENKEKEPEKPRLILTNYSDYVLPDKEEDRLDILIMGIRGEDDEFAAEGGALLTDTIMVFSYNKETKKSSLISIPRDLYVIVDKNAREARINTIYETGIIRDRNLDFTKDLLSKITGVYIDHAIVFDFSSFKKIIDDLGGIEIYLDEPFIENNQWGFEFKLASGSHTLDGENALYYARSRFSSNDFNRSLRQQRVISAAKEKILQLNLIKNPVRTLTTLNTLQSNIDTDMNIWDIGTIINLAKNIDLSDESIEKYVISTDNLLYHTFHGEMYILLPEGDDFSVIKTLFKEILEQNSS